MTGIFTDTVSGVNFEVHPLDAGFYPEVDILDVCEAGWVGHLADEEADAAAEEAEFDEWMRANADRLADDGMAYDGMMAGLYD